MKKELMYHFKNSITHESKCVSDKVNFFADYFEFGIMNLGNFDGIELENHRSVRSVINYIAYE